MVVYFGHGMERAERLEDLRWLQQRARQKARLRQHQRTKLTERARVLEEALGEQMLLHQALIRVLFETKTVDRAAFLAVLRELDLLDGAADGKLARAPKTAPAANTPETARKGGARKVRRKKP